MSPTQLLRMRGPATCHLNSSRTGPTVLRRQPGPPSMASFARHSLPSPRETLAVPTDSRVNVFLPAKVTGRLALSSRETRSKVAAVSSGENKTKAKEGDRPAAPQVEEEPNKTVTQGGTGDAGGLSDSESEVIRQGSAVLGFAIVALVVGIGSFAYVYKDEVNNIVEFFSSYVEDAGPLGYVAFTLGYAALEVLAIPAIPITMSAGLLFGPVVGTAMCSAAATIAATGAFLITRYVARDRILNLVKDNKKFLAIDKAVGEDSFRVVTLLRLSPLLPFSLGNYVYGLTSVKLVPYVLGSWIGMLPGTYAYVSAGALGRTLLDAEGGGVSVEDSSVWTLAVGLVFTLAAAAYVTNLAKNAVKDLD